MFILPVLYCSDCLSLANISFDLAEEVMASLSGVPM